MAKYKPLDRGKYQTSFDQMFGEGRYEQGMQSARDTGRLKVEASLARKEYQKRQEELEAARKKAEKEKAKAKATELPKAAEGRKKPESKSKSGDGVLDKLVSGAKSVYKGVHRFDDIMTNAITLGLKGELDKRTQKRFDAKGVDINLTDYLNPREKGDYVGKGTDLLANLVGYGVTGIGATQALRGAGLTGKGINALTQASKAGNVTKPLLKRAAIDSAKEGALIGGAMATGESAVRLGLNKEADTSLKRELGNIALGTVLGGALDPLATVAAPAMKYASRSAVDNAIVSQGAEALGQAVRRADISPQGFRMASQNPANIGTQQLNEMLLGQANRPEQALQQLVRSQNPLTNMDVPTNVPAAPQARASQQVMNEVSAGRIDPRMKRQLPSDLTAGSSRATKINPTPPAARHEQEAVAAQLRNLQMDKQAVDAELTQLLPRQNRSNVRQIHQLQKQSRELERTISEVSKRQEFFTMPTRSVLEGSDISSSQNLRNPLGEFDFGRLQNRRQTVMDDLLGVPKADDAVNPANMDADVPNYLASETNRPAATPTNSNLNASDSLQEMASTRATSSLDELLPNRELQQVTSNTSLEQAMRNAEGIEPTLARDFADPDTMPNPLAEAVEEPKPTLSQKLKNTKGALYREVVSETGEFKRFDEKALEWDKASIGKVVDGDSSVNPNAARVLNELPDGSLASEDSIHKQFRLLKTAPQRAVKVAEQRVKPIIESLKKHNITKSELDNYSLARHAVDIHERNATNAIEAQALKDQFERLTLERADYSTLKEIESELLDLSPYKLPEEATLDWAEAVLNKYKGNSGMEDTHKLLLKAQRKSLKEASMGGTISEDTYRYLVNYHPNYVSLARDVSPQGSLGTGATKVRNPVGTRGEGSESLKILSVTDNVFKNAYLTNFNVQKNKAFEPIVKYASLDEAGEFFAKRKSPSSKTVTVFREGIPEHYEVPEYMAWYANKGANKEFSNVLLDSTASVANLLKKGSTHYNIPFHFISAFRDTQNAIWQSRTGNPIQMVGNVTHGFLDSFMGETLEKATKGAFKSNVKGYVDMGGGQHQWISTNKESITASTEAIMNGTFGDSKRSIVMKPLDWIEKFGNAMERGPKLGEMRAAQKAGYDPQSAFFEAVDVMDYADVGRVTKEANKVIPYVGATMRGNARVMRAFQENPTKATLRGISMFTLPTMGIYSMRFLDSTSDEQRAELANMADWQKNMYWHIPIPNSPDHTILSMQKPHFLGQMFANPAERVLDQVYDQTLKTNAEAGKLIMSDLAKSLAPPTEIAGLNTLRELSMNMDSFSKQNIESQRDIDNAVPTREREGYDQSELGKGIANLLNIGQEEGWASPAKVDHAIRDTTGTLGRQTLNVVDDISAATLGTNAKPRNAMDELLKPATQFIADPTRSSGIYADLKGLAAREKRNTNTPMTNMTEDEKNVERANRPLQNYKKAMQEYDAAIQEIRSDKTKSSQEKNREISDMRKQQDSLGVQLIDWYNSLR